MDGKVVIGTELDTKGFEKEIEMLEEKLNDIKQTLVMASEDKTLFSTREVKEMEVEAEKLARKIEGLKEKQEKLDKTGFENMKKSAESLGNSISTVINKTVKWGLAIFGIRSAYSAVRQAIGLVSSQNDEVSNKIEQMRNVIAGALLPVVQTVINFLAKIMVYINYIVYALTGKNIFNFADATKKSSDNLASGASSARGIADNLKEARKQLAGFDEMNVLNDNVASSGGGGGTGVGGVGPVDFGNIFDDLQNIQMPKWIEDLVKVLKKIKKYWKELIPVVAAFGTTLAAVKIGTFLQSLLGIEAISTAVVAGFAMMAGGATLLIGEIVNLVMNWDRMTTKEKVLSASLATLGAAFVALGYSIATGVSAATLGIGALIAAIIAMTAALTTSIYKEITLTDAIYDERIQQEEATKAKERAKKAYDDLIDAVDRQTAAQENLIEVEQRNQMSGEELWASVQNGTLTYQGMTKQQRETYKAYLELQDANENLQNANEELINSNSEVIKKDFDVQIANDKTGKTYNKLRDDIVEAYNKGEITAKDASDSISRMMGNMSYESYETFTKDIPDNIKSGLDAGKYKNTFDKFADLWNSWINSLQKKLTIQVSETHYSSGTGRYGAKGAIVTYPKLAVGGIVNQPGRGVPLGGAIIGERGAEGVIPLTDSQQMALLGEAIGRYITVNTSITNTMNGRVISRELVKTQNEEDFAFNR